VADPGEGQFGAVARSKRLWRPSNKNALLFGAYQRRNKGKNTQSKINNVYTSLNFSISVTEFDPASYRVESTLLLFRNSVFVISSFLMLGGSFEMKSNSQNRKAISVENLELTKYFGSLQSEN